MAKRNAVKVHWDRKKLAEKRGHWYIEISVYLCEGQRKFYSFGSATAMEWLRIKNSKELQKQVDKYTTIVEAMHTLGEDLTIANFEAHLDIKEVVDESKKQSGSLYNGYDPMDSFIEYVRDMQTQENVTKATMKHKRVTLRSLEEFGRIQTLADLTPANIMAYDRFLHDGIRKDVTIATYHKYVRYYINILLMEERIPRNPYARVKIKKGESKIRQPLTEAELVKVRDAVITREKLDRVRDLFIFMAYTRLSYIDTQHFDFKKMTVYDEASGMYFIDGKRLKTKTDYFTPILAPAMSVLKKNDYKLLKISNQKANDHLHTIEEKLGITHPMTCHCFPHRYNRSKHHFYPAVLLQWLSASLAVPVLRCYSPFRQLHTMCFRCLWNNHHFHYGYPRIFFRSWFLVAPKDSFPLTFSLMSWKSVTFASSYHCQAINALQKKVFFCSVQQ